ncbi:hypothetical protein E3N88_07322 [Mikania micrantha]|uniref:Uncharacterized protein n=1 Tax=Mikania micrantha TaxID=192012 RepID=A0A5N6PSN2_9ASTR|nr:hypothetical protein E3N88_07322 [Mikania micrantha]
MMQCEILSTSRCFNPSKSINNASSSSIEQRRLKTFKFGSDMLGIVRDSRSFHEFMALNNPVSTAGVQGGVQALVVEEGRSNSQYSPNENVGFGVYSTPTPQASQTPLSQNDSQQQFSQQQFSVNTNSVEQQEACKAFVASFECFTASSLAKAQFTQHDLEEIDPKDVEEMDIKWQMAMVVLRHKKFWKKYGPMKFEADKTKVEHDENFSKLTKTLSDLSTATLKLESFETSSKHLTNLLNSQLQGKSKAGLGFHEVPPPYNENYTPMPESMTSPKVVFQNSDSQNQKSVIGDDSHLFSFKNFVLAENNSSDALKLSIENKTVNLMTSENQSNLKNKQKVSNSNQNLEKSNGSKSSNSDLSTKCTICKSLSHTRKHCTYKSKNHFNKISEFMEKKKRLQDKHYSSVSANTSKYCSICRTNNHDIGDCYYHQPGLECMQNSKNAAYSFSNSIVDKTKGKSGNNAYHSRNSKDSRFRQNQSENKMFGNYYQPQIYPYQQSRVSPQQWQTMFGGYQHPTHSFGTKQYYNDDSYGYNFTPPKIRKQNFHKTKASNIFHDNSFYESDPSSHHADHKSTLKKSVNKSSGYDSFSSLKVEKGKNNQKKVSFESQFTQNWKLKDDSKNKQKDESDLPDLSKMQKVTFQTFGNGKPKTWEAWVPFSNADEVSVLTANADEVSVLSANADEVSVLTVSNADEHESSQRRRGCVKMMDVDDDKALDVVYSYERGTYGLWICQRCCSADNQSYYAESQLIEDIDADSADEQILKC